MIPIRPAATALLFLLIVSMASAQTRKTETALDIDASDYVRRLESALQAIDRAKLAVNDRNIVRQETNFARNLLKRRMRVKQDETTVEPDLLPLNGDLALASAASEKTRLEALEKARLRLSSLLLNARQAGRFSTNSTDDTQSRKVLLQVLRRKEFKVNEGETLMERFIRWLGEWLISIFPRINFSGMGSLATILMWGVIGALIALLAYIIYSIAPLLIPGMRLRRVKQSEGVELRSARPKSVDELRGLARAALAKGNYREALGIAFKAILLVLDSHRWIEFDESRTNGEYVRALHTVPAVRDLIGPVALRFDERWYGFKETRPDDVEFFLQRLEEVEMSDATTQR